MLYKVEHTDFGAVVRRVRIPPGDEKYVHLLIHPLTNQIICFGHSSALSLTQKPLRIRTTRLKFRQMFF